MEIKGARLGIGYEQRIVLQDFDITIRKGEITTFVGPNGSGKSTVLKTLTRLLRCRKGTVFCDNIPLPEIPSREFAKRVAVLPQQHLVPPDFTVHDLVSYGRVPYQSWHGSNSAEDEKVVEWAMRATGVWPMREKPSRLAAAENPSGFGLLQCWPSNRKFCFWMNLPRS